MGPVTSDLRARLADARLYLCTDSRRARGDLPEFLDAVLAAGVDIVQLREKGLEAREELQLIEVFADACRRHGRLLAVNDRADVALAAGSDVLHLGQDDLSPEGARLVVGTRLVGISAHNSQQVKEADASPADYIAIGPVFPTTGKKNPDELVGLKGVSAARAATRKPLVAIGGITRSRAKSVIEAGADSVAVISDLLSSPRQAAEEFLRLLV